MTRARLLICGASALFSVPVQAAPPAEYSGRGDDELAELQALLDEPVVSTASQSLELANIAPATSISIRAEDLRRFGIRSLDEATNYLGMGMVTQNPLHSVDIGARGVLLSADFGNHVLLLVNGHAMNEQWDGTAYFERGAAIPFELIDHLEIILGPGSVLYGSNAMLGVINIITKRAKDWRGYHLVAESELPVSMRIALGVGRELSLFGHSGELTLALEYYTQSGPAFTFGPQQYGNDAVTMMPKRFDPSGTNAGVWGGVADRSYWTRIPTAYARLAVGHLSLDVRAARYKRGTPYVNQFNQVLGDFNDPAGWERDRWISADLKHNVLLSEIAELRSRLYADAYDYLQESRISAPEDCLEGQTSGCARRLLGVSRWAGLEEQVTLDWLRNGRLVTLLGSDGRVRHASTQIDDTDIITGANPGAIASSNRTEYAIGTYVQQTAHLVRPAERRPPRRRPLRVRDREVEVIATWPASCSSALA
jgi:hypothetical protein